MALITEAFYTARYGAGDSTQILAFIDDVGAEIVDYVNTLDTDPDNPVNAGAWDETTTPEAIRAVVARVVNRAIGNPLGITQEGLGDHNRAFFGAGAIGGLMGPKDRRIVRRAAGVSAAQDLELEGYLPLPREDLADDDLGL